MVKEYWNYNKKSLSITAFSGIVYILFFKFFAARAEFQQIAEGADITTDASSILFFAGLSFLLGMIALFYIIMLLYSYIKPFINKQFQKTTSMGNDPRKYLLVHIIVILMFTIIDLAFTIISKNFDIISEFSIYSMIKTILSSFATPLWIMAIPLTLMNGRIANDMSPSKRKILIIGGYALLWCVLSLACSMPNINQIIFTNLNGATLRMNETTLQITQASVLELIVDFVGIFIFIVAYNAFTKNYEVI